MSTSSDKSSSDEIIDYCEQNDVNYITSLECFRKDFEVKFLVGQAKVRIEDFSRPEDTRNDILIGLIYFMLISVVDLNFIVFMVYYIKW